MNPGGYLQDEQREDGEITADGEAIEHEKVRVTD